MLQKSKINRGDSHEKLLRLRVSPSAFNTRDLVLSDLYDIAVDRIDGAIVPRSWDQPHAIQGGIGRTGREWDWTVAANWHSGWPRTLFDGPRNGARFGNFASVDARVNRRVPISRGTLLFSAEVTNLLNRDNPCCVSYTTETLPDGETQLDTRLRYWLPLVPSLGVLWQF